MRSDKYNDRNRDNRFDTRAYDGWEETQMLFQSRNREREELKKRKQREEAYREYLAMREHPNANRSPKSKQKKRRVKRIILVILLLLIILAAAGVMAVMGLMEKVGDLEIDSSNLGIDPQVAEELKDYQNIALLGIDARDMDDYENCRTDAMIILSLDKKNDTIRQISVYRDTYLHVNEEYGYDKITNVHAFT